MLSYKEFVLNEADKQTEIEKIKLEITKKFEDIKKNKEAKNTKIKASKDANFNSNLEITSINYQANAYAQISALMKKLAVKMKEDLQAKAKEKPKTTEIY